MCKLSKRSCVASAQPNPYTVTYDSESHWSVLTQITGSKWHSVLPYCLFNVGVMVALILVDTYIYHGPVVEISTQGHTFLTMVVSFLLVSRVTTALSRYNAARENLGTMYREARELVQEACALSRTASIQTPESAEWRHELAYRVCILLRCVMAVVDYPDESIPAWTIPELNGNERKFIYNDLFATSSVARRWAHADHNDWEETMRVPIRLAYLVRQTICSQSERLEKPIHISQENRLLSSVSSFNSGYYGIRKFLSTPVPFPLVQMSRTFLFIYVFTVPFVLLQDPSSHVAHCFMVFFMTYAFMGLADVAVELDNPFGSDANDFRNNILAETAYEDVYLAIRDIDGPDWADKLRVRMWDNTKCAKEELPSEQSWLLTSNNLV